MPGETVPDEHDAKDGPFIATCGECPVKEGPLLAEIVERIGMGPAQVKAGFLGGGVYLADGAELLLISSVTRSLAETWGLHGFQQGFVVTMVYTGLLLGNLIGGPIGDLLGRRTMVVISYAGVASMGIASSFAEGYRSFGISRLFVGLSIGLGQPAWNALGSELSPADWRLVTTGFGQFLFPLGEVYSAFLLLSDDPTLQDLSWRHLLRLGAIPAFLLLLMSALWLPESPSFLAMRGHPEEAKATLRGLARENGKNPDSISFAVPQARSYSLQPPFLERVQTQMNIIFGKRLFGTTLIVMYSCFVLNLSYFGSLFAFPQVLPAVLDETAVAASELLIGALWELPGFAVALLIGIFVQRKLGIKIYLGLSTVSFAVFGCSLLAHRSFSSEVALRLSYYGIKFFVNIGFVIIYQYSVEVYPTEARITGAALNLAAGRLAAMAAPVLFELTVEAAGGFAPFFVGIAVAMLLNAGLIHVLPFETAGVLLHDAADDMDSTSSSLPIFRSPSWYGAEANAPESARAPPERAPPERQPV